MVSTDPTTQPTKEYLASAFQPHEVLSPTPAKLAWIWRVMELSYQCNVSYVMARRAVELAEQTTREH
jgi:hypothetical protein